MARCFMFFFILTSYRVAGQSPIYALKGQEVNLKPAIIGQPKEILWKYQGNKVVEFNGNEQTVYSPYEERITLDWMSAELNITNLTYEDSGDYELEVYMNQELKRSPFLLEVIDRVATPCISCEMEDGSRSATLVCSAESRQHQSLMKFDWYSHEHVQPGPNFTISLGDKYDDEIYTCRVSNPLSYETATYTAKDCYPEKSLFAVLIASIFTIPILLFVPLVVYFKVHRKACFAKGNRDLENPTTKGSAEKTTWGDEDSPLLSNGNMRPNGQDRDHKEDADPDLETVEGIIEQRKQLFEQKTGGNILPKKALRAHGLDVQDGSPEKGLENKPLGSVDLASNDKGDADADQLSKDAGEKIPQCEPSDSEKANEPEPPCVLEDTQSNLESSNAPEQPGIIEQRKQLFEQKTGGNILPKKALRETMKKTDHKEEA